ncbi:MAG: NAD-dependent epimerase/dehydratase family protein [Bryobacterales bacterium]|nr:NAD-dependent epimerase/dehydratase family protein [Bryobacterales bacterium]
MNRVLVIGGTLFIGRALVRRLLDRGDDVTVLHRGSRNPFKLETREVRCDRNDTEALAKVLRQGFDIVFDNVYDWERGTTGEQVARAAAASPPLRTRYVFMSSCAAYGSGLDRHESSPLAGPDHPEEYCRNKADSERGLFALHSSTGLAATTLRPPFVYGPHNPFYREAFFWDRLVEGRPILIPGDGSRLMHLVHVWDLAECALRAAESPASGGRAYNVGHSHAIRQDDLVTALGRAAGIEPDVRYVPRATIERLGGSVFAPPFYFGQYFDMPPITLNTAKARRELSFEPRTLASGLRNTWQWYESTQRRTRRQPDFSFEDAVIEAIGQEWSRPG